MIYHLNYEKIFVNFFIEKKIDVRLYFSLRSAFPISFVTMSYVGKNAALDEVVKHEKPMPYGEVIFW